MGLERIDNWQFYMAFNFFRGAAIIQGVYKRTLDGTLKISLQMIFFTRKLIIFSVVIVVVF